jgi:nicotinate-nucleotide adenylyltransferase
MGVLIGTFDPIHHNHLSMARHATRALSLDTVLFVPTGTPSHRDPAGVSAASDRCAMVRLAVSDERRFALSTVDATRLRPTYTVDTLRDLREDIGARAELFLIIGADNLATLPRWRESTELPRLAHIVGSPRRGHRLTDPGLPAGRLTLLRLRHEDISATEIRRCVRDGRAVHHLTPEPVAWYVREHALYGADPLAGACGMAAPRSSSARAIASACRSRPDSLSIDA